MILDWCIKIIRKLRLNVESTCKFTGMKALSVVFRIPYTSTNVEVHFEYLCTFYRFVFCVILCMNIDLMKRE